MGAADNLNGVVAEKNRRFAAREENISLLARAIAAGANLLTVSFPLRLDSTSPIP